MTLSLQTWRIVRIILLVVLGPYAVGCICYTLCTVLAGSSSTYGVTEHPIGPVDGSSPAAPRTARIPLYTAPNGPQLGEMTWWEYFDPADAQDGWLPLESSTKESPVKRLGKKVGGWVRCKDLSFDWRDVARLDAQLSGTQRFCDKLDFADWNGDGSPEILKSHSDAMLGDAVESITIVGTPNGKPMEYLSLSWKGDVWDEPGIEKIKLPDHSTAFATRGMIWNNLAYRWQDGRYTRTSLHLKEKRDALGAEFGKTSGIMLVVCSIPVVWWVLLVLPWTLGASAQPARKVLLGLLLMLCLLAWMNYRFLGYEGVAPWRHTMLILWAAATALLLLAARNRYLAAVHAQGASIEPI